MNKLVALQVELLSLTKKLAQYTRQHCLALRLLIQPEEIFSAWMYCSSWKFPSIKLEIFVG